MKRVSIKGVFIGGIVDMASSILFGGIFALLAIFLLHEIARVPHTVVIRSVQLRLALFIIGLASSMAGGFVSAKVARHDELPKWGLIFGAVRDIRNLSAGNWGP